MVIVRRSGSVGVRRTLAVVARLSSVPGWVRPADWEDRTQVMTGPASRTTSSGPSTVTGVGLHAGPVGLIPGRSRSARCQGSEAGLSARHPILVVATVPARHEETIMTAVLPGTVDVRKAVPADAAAVAAALAVAFTDDPVFCWMLPDADVRRVATRRFFELVVDIIRAEEDSSSRPIRPSTSAPNV